MTNKSLVPEQIDRDRAESFRRGSGGKYDRDVEHLAEAFTAHRLAEQERCAGVATAAIRSGSSPEPIAKEPLTGEREAIARIIHHKFYAVVVGHDDCLDWEEMPQRLRDMYLAGADAILALRHPEPVKDTVEMARELLASHGRFPSGDSVPFDVAERIVAAALTRQAKVEGDDGYATAFYDIAGMLGIGARSKSPREVWESEMRPKLLALLDTRGER